MTVKQFVLAMSGAAMVAAIGLPASAQDPIKIGSSLPLTGGFAITGQKHKEGFEMCIDKINEAGGLLGRPVELIVVGQPFRYRNCHESIRTADQCRWRRPPVRNLLEQIDLSGLFGHRQEQYDSPGSLRRRIAHLGAGPQAHVLLPASPRRIYRQGDR